MYNEPQAVLAKNVVDVMSHYSALFREMCIPAVYQGDDESIGLTQLPICIPSKQVRIGFANDYLDENKAVGQCVIFPGADYMTQYAMLNYPEFDVTFTVRDNCVPEDVIFHELIHVYQYTYEYNYFYCADGYKNRNKEIERKFHKQYVAPARAKLLRKLNGEVRKAYSKREKVMIDACYHVLFQEDNKAVGKQHDLVFYRLSILLDRMMNYPPGTIFGYSLCSFIEDVRSDIENEIA